MNADCTCGPNEISCAVIYAKHAEKWTRSQVDQHDCLVTDLRADVGLDREYQGRHRAATLAVVR